ncbi:MAG: class I SAM-dependent methyltransferase [Myxococcota bacterium]|nr:class I SAM-dependent methyltransferase [Myxococcota bacterium]
MSTDRDHRARIAREREFFAVPARAGEERSWAETTPIAPRRREMRTRRLVAGAAIEDARGRGRLVLDIGCGTGTYTSPLAAQTEATIIGIDVTPETLVEGRKVVPSNVRLAASDAVRLPFAEATFDAVVGNAVLHHLPLERALPELIRVLRPGGRLCFGEPNFVNPHLFVMLNVPSLRRRVGATPDETAFVRWPLRRTLHAHGFVDIEVQPFDFMYPAVPAGWIDAVEALGRVLEATPGIREISGSLLIRGQKPV